MCTLSWKPLEDGYVLFFNRDESRNRVTAQGPTLRQKNGVDFLAPTDGARGGTWLLVNAHGICIGLLNNYAATSPAVVVNASSRGFLPLNCSDCVSVIEAIDRIAEMPLNDYPPFHLVVAAANEAVMLTWDGSACTSAVLGSSGEMLTTSMFKPKLVAQVRDEIFTSVVGDITDAKPETLKAFHWFEGPDSATSIKMSRPDACTHSISEITVSLDKETAYFQYSPQAGINGDERVLSPTSIFIPLTKHL